MNKTELAIIEQIALLDEPAQVKLLEQVRQLVSDTQKPKFDLGEWLEKAHKIREDLTAKYGEDHYFDSVETLREIREEESE